MQMAEVDAVVRHAKVSAIEHVLGQWNSNIVGKENKCEKDEKDEETSQGNYIGTFTARRDFDNHGPKHETANYTSRGWPDGRSKLTRLQNMQISYLSCKTFGGARWSSRASVQTHRIEFTSGGGLK